VLTVDRVVDRALRTNPELRRLEAEVDRASADQLASWTRYLPTVSLSYSESRTANAGAPGDFFQFDLPNTSDNIRMSASWSLFEGFGRREQTARARAEGRRARADRRRQRLEIERRVRDRVDEVKRRAERLDLLEEQFRAARERLELSREGYRAGTVSFDELQRAIDELTNSERDLVRERFDYLVAWARLEEEAGTVGR
jgi:outer membrane protein TolC